MLTKLHIYTAIETHKDITCIQTKHMKFNIMFPLNNMHGVKLLADGTIRCGDVFLSASWRVEKDILIQTIQLKNEQVQVEVRQIGGVVHGNTFQPKRYYTYQVG